MATVNGVTTAPSVYGQIVATTDDAKIAGGGGNDVLYSTGGNATYYGGAGSDTFVITQASLLKSDPTTNGYTAEAVIYDFANAGIAWTATNSDFIRLVGFGTSAQGTTLTFDHYGDADGTHTVDPTRQYYTIHNGVTGQDFEIYVHSLNGSTLVLGDYNFY